MRRARVLRIVLFAALFCLWLHLLIPGKSDDVAQREFDRIMNSNTTSEQVLAQVPLELRKYLHISMSNQTAGNGTGGTAIRWTENVPELRKAIEKYNEAQTILNEDTFGPVESDTIIIAIQVHTRLTYLRHLIISLAQAKYIEKTLLIFSHDYFDDEINYLVQSIDFCKVMQIFYPYSIQSHPNEFPGVSPQDCPRDASQQEALKLKCTNSLHPDVYGHYREAKYTQTKHHWWWKANRIFNQLQATAHHTGMVVFLEEDHYVASDFLHVLELMRETADKICPLCTILSLGTYLTKYQHFTADKNRRVGGLRQAYLSSNVRKMAKQRETWSYHVYPHFYGTTQKVDITPWVSSLHNMGMVLNRTIWSEIVSLRKEFCQYDDYNWDWSLLHLSQNRPHGKEMFKTLMCKGPRVFHIGECGIHHKKSDCNPSAVIGKVQKLLNSVKGSLFPHKLVASMNPGRVKDRKKLKKGNGGWGDVRDHELCLNMTLFGRETVFNPYAALQLGNPE